MEGLQGDYLHLHFLFFHLFLIPQLSHKGWRGRFKYVICGSSWRRGKEERKKGEKDEREMKYIKSTQIEKSLERNCAK
jgi:hypothetical protein